MITIEQAKALRRGDILLEYPNISTVKGKALLLTDEKPKRWKVNGKIKLWKRDTERFELPIKHGLYLYGTLTEYNSQCMTIEGA